MSSYIEKTSNGTKDGCNTDEMRIYMTLQPKDDDDNIGMARYTMALSNACNMRITPCTTTVVAT
jgi:hypothetical protein